AKDMSQKVGYVNAGTVEFLVSGDAFYFIEVNPRVQVEHTITEMVTGVDIVRTQIQIADGNGLFGEVINMPAQEDIPLMGYAVNAALRLRILSTISCRTRVKSWHIVPQEVSVSGSTRVMVSRVRSFHLTTIHCL